METITENHALFIAEYGVDWNGAAAYRRAFGYAGSNADALADQMMKRPGVRAAIDTMKADRLARLRVDADGVLMRLLQAAESEISDIMNEDGTVKPMSSWPAIWKSGYGRCSGVKFDAATGKITEIKMDANLARLKLIGDHISVAAYKAQATMELSGAVGLADRLERATARHKVDTASDAGSSHYASAAASAPVTAAPSITPPDLAPAPAEPVASVGDWQEPPAPSAPPAPNLKTSGQPAVAAPTHQPTMPFDGAASPWPDHPAVADMNYWPVSDLGKDI